MPSSLVERRVMKDLVGHFISASCQDEKCCYVALKCERHRLEEKARLATFMARR
jgi:hypothetical protein